MQYAEVILPLPLANTYTYHITPDIEKVIVPGCRVIVPFGKKKYYTAIVVTLHNSVSGNIKQIKDITTLLDASPILREPQLKLWNWIARYYVCKLGDVYKAALPSGLKLESETAVTYNLDFEAESPLPDKEQTILNAFSDKKKRTPSELEKQTGLTNIMPLLSRLMEKGAVRINENLKKGYRPKTEPFVRLAPQWQNEEQVHKAFDLCKRSEKRERLLVTYIDLSNAVRNPEKDKSLLLNNKNAFYKEVSKKELLERSDCSPAILMGLRQKGILEVYDKPIDRLRPSINKCVAPYTLTTPQVQAYTDIYEVFKEKEVCLLKGITSSGKTEIYIHLIADALRADKQVLYLLPEIAVTTQITERLARHFGKQMWVYHSKFSDNERVEIWNKLLNSHEPLLIVGVRSSLFLPFSNLSLIIIDEEHEPSFKQQNPAPRYHGRDVAVVLAHMHQAKVLMGTATPSLDSYFNALQGKYGLVELNERYGLSAPPRIIPIDIKELRRKKQMTHEFLSPPLIEEMSKAFAKKEQVILFQNRRGFSPMIECRACGWTPRCIHCDVGMTYHKFKNQLVCHYCGYTYRMPDVCPACHEEALRLMGYGTEKVAEEVKLQFPECEVARLDFDTTRTRTAYEHILEDFASEKQQVLIGTQMISKGLDFAKVSVVGILNADSLLSYPDFRAYERAFQLLLQVSGRAGRRAEQGTVILQTKNPEEELLQWVVNADYHQMAQQQLEERKTFRFPPYYRMIKIVIRSKNKQTLFDMARLYTQHLRDRLGQRVLGPIEPPVAKVQTLYIQHVFLKIENTAGIDPIRRLLELVYGEMRRIPEFRRLFIHYDIDPA